MNPKSALNRHLIACLEKWTDCPRVKCACPDCPTLIPFWWYSGMCGPCGREDCEHDTLAPSAPPEEAKRTEGCKGCACAEFGTAKLDYCPCPCHAPEAQKEKGNHV